MPAMRVQLGTFTTLILINVFIYRDKWLNGHLPQTVILQFSHI